MRNGEVLLRDVKGVTAAWVRVNAEWKRITVK